MGSECEKVLFVSRMAEPEAKVNGKKGIRIWLWTLKSGSSILFRFGINVRWGTPRLPFWGSSLLRV